MNSTNTELHPNWRALATVHLPLKRFIKAGEVVPPTLETQKYEIPGSGEEAKEFYEKIIKEKTTQHAQLPKKIQKLIIKQTNATITKVQFEKQKFFRCAQENDIVGLAKFDPQTIEVDCRDDFGWTALMMAACEGAFDTASMLLELGADSSLKDKSGNTALDFASRKSHLKLMNLLEVKVKTEVECVEKLETNIKIEPFHCNICKRTFSETTRAAHQTSTVHQFNEKSRLPLNKLHRFNISPKNRGLQLMVKQGWDKESGLGPTLNGRLYPLKTVIRKQRTGLGVEQSAARVTHFDAFDVRATQHQIPNYVKKKQRKSEKVREWKRERRLRRELS